MAVGPNLGALTFPTENEQNRLRHMVNLAGFGVPGFDSQPYGPTVA